LLAAADSIVLTFGVLLLLVVAGGGRPQVRD
jgi:hypothetical protein